MSAIEKYIPADGEIDRIQRIATDFAESGYFADTKSALQAYVKISAGAEMGLQPFVSMSGIAIIQGKPVVGSGILAGLLDDHPDFDYTVTWEPNSTEPTACTVTVLKNGKERGASRFSMEDAEKAGLASKDVWKKFRRNMLFARAMSNAVAWYAPSVTRSNGRVFVEGELDDVIDVKPTPVPRRKREATPVSPNEQVVDAEVVEAAPADSGTAAEDNPEASVESEVAVSTTAPTDLAKAAYAECSKAEKDAIKESCKQLGIVCNSASLVERFGDATSTREGLLRALAMAVNPPQVIEGEVPFGEEPSADAFAEFLEDDTARNIAAAEAAQDEAARRIKGREKMAKAGSYGES